MVVISNEVRIRIDTLRDAGKKPAFISKQLNLKYETVKKYFYRSKIVEGLPPKIVVKKTYFSGRIPGIIKRYVMDFPIANDMEILLGCGLTYSRQYLNKYLNANGLSRVRAKRNILLREINKAKRVKFAKEMLKKSNEELKLILWSDETSVKAFPNSEAVFYRSNQRREDIVSPNVQQGGASQMLWGCMSFYAYGPLTAVEGHIDAPKYLKLLQDIVKPELDASASLNRVLTFQQDNAKPHTRPIIMEYFQSWGYETLDWPPQSPDLSPIENIWNIMKMKMKAMRPRPRSKAAMRNAMLDIWDNLEDKVRQDLILTFRKRCEDCVKNKGNLVRF